MEFGKWGVEIVWMLSPNLDPARIFLGAVFVSHDTCSPRVIARATARDTYRVRSRASARGMYGSLLFWVEVVELARWRCDDLSIQRVSRGDFDQRSRTDIRAIPTRKLVVAWIGRTAQSHDLPEPTAMDVDYSLGFGLWLWKRGVYHLLGVYQYCGGCAS